MQFDSNFIRLVTKSEPGAVATGQGLNGKTDASNAKSLRNLSSRPVATAPGSDFVLALLALSIDADSGSILKMRQYCQPPISADPHGADQSIRTVVIKVFLQIRVPR
jgi:hypothetical protein